MAGNVDIAKIPGHPGYGASRDGRIWSFKSGTVREMRCFRRGRQGHLGVNLTQAGKYRLYSVHRLIALTFIGEPPSSAHCVMHRDDDPAHNADRNLVYGLPKENSAQMVARSRSASGERCARAKLTAAEVVLIRAALESGVTGRVVAATFGVSAANISDIKRRHIWRY